MVLALSGCSGDGTTFGDTNGAPSTGVYVIQNTAATTTTPATGTVLQFSTSASGAATPDSTIANLNVTSLAFLAVDGTGDIYTTATEGTTGTSILEFPVDSSNNAQPTRGIPFNTTTGLSGINGLAVDATGDIYSSGSTNGVSVFSSTATGSVAPSSSIPIITSPSGATTLEFPYADAVDPSGNLYVANESSAAIINPPVAPIVVFAPGATGSVAPTRTLSGALTTLTSGSPQGLATDSAGNLYVTNVVSGVSSILIFEPTATGNTPPLRDITGSNTLLGCVGGIALDNEGYLYVVSVPTCGSTTSPTVLKFSTTGDGNIAPIATFTSSAWTNADPSLSIAVY
jgi:sugar lactone lactonase YvrE